LALKAAEEATATVPIIMVAIDYDPLARGHIASLAHPGGNVTGVFLQQLELTAKRLQLLTEAVPRISRLWVLWDAMSADQFKAAQTAAALLRIPLEPVQLTDLPYNYERALAGTDGMRGEALMVMTSPLLSRDQARVPELALRHRLPSIFVFKANTDAGGLMSYGPSVPEMFRIAAGYVDKIAKGAKPEDLPVEQPTKFELVVNLKTAKALGLTIPPFMLARADEVIE